MVFIELLLIQYIAVLAFKLMSTCYRPIWPLWWTLLLKYSWVMTSKLTYDQHCYQLNMSHTITISSTYGGCWGEVRGSPGRMRLNLWFYSQVTAPVHNRFVSQCRSLVWEFHCTQRALICQCLLWFQLWALEIRNWH